MENLAFLDCWYITTINQNPDQSVYCLCGIVDNHPKKTNGTHITTSHIVSIDEDDIVTTHSGTRYKLLNVNPEYERIYPNTLEKLKKLLST